LALLSAYLEDRPLYLFDEWAADQDPYFKEVFYRRLLPQLKAQGKTVLVISHDDRYFDVADRLVRFREGKIVFAGPVHDLSAQRAVVVLGAARAAGEIAWILASARPPFHPTRSRVDDNSVLDFIFGVAEHNFGWLHIDCFVLNPQLFTEMATLAEDTVANCIW